MDLMRFVAGPRARTEGRALKGNQPDLAYFVLEDLIALSASRNGYARERALKELLRRGGGSTIKALLPRASDYVVEIQALVRAGLPRYFDARFIPDWIAARDDLMALYRVQRVDLSALRKSIEEFVLPYAELMGAAARESRE